MTDTQAATGAEPAGAELHLPKPPGILRRLWWEHPRVADTVLAVVLGLVCVASASDTDGGYFGSPGQIVVALPFIVVAVAGVYVRRTRPWLALAGAGAVLVTWFWAPDPAVLAPVVFAVYTIARRRSVSAGWITAGAVEVAGVVIGIVSGHFTPLESRIESLMLFATQLAVALIIAVLAGINLGNRKRYLSALVDRAHQLARERDQQAELAAAAERARIAREMHDVVSHSLTVMVALAEGAAVAAAGSNPAQASTAMRRVADTGRAALIDMRRMLGVLGGDSRAGLAPQPRMADLPALLARFRELGLPVALRVEGDVPDDPALHLTIYRVVQEAVTNALRYAESPSAVLVVVDAGDDSLVVTVQDDGRGTARATSIGAGRGLLGLAERVTALEGRFSAGPRTDGHGWATTAVLPSPAAEPKQVRA